MKIISPLLLSVTLLLTSCDRGGRLPVFDDALIGHTAPEFSLPQVGSTQPLKLSDYRGKLVMLNFWASWCPPCRAEVPSFVEIQKQYAGQHFTILGISIDEQADMMPYINAQGINYPLSHGVDAGNQLAAHYGNPDGALPYSVLISPAQKVLGIYTGIIHKEQFETLLKKHL